MRPPFRAHIAGRPPNLPRRGLRVLLPEQPPAPTSSQDDGTTAAGQDQVEQPLGQHGAGTSSSTTQGGASAMPPPEKPPRQARRGHPGVAEEKRRNKDKCSVKGCDSAGMNSTCH